MIRAGLVLLAALLGCTAQARAEDAGKDTPVRLEGAALFDAPRSGPELWIGGGPLAYPRYPGSARERVRPIPEITGGWGERFDFDVLDGARLAIVQAGGFSAGPAVRVRFGRHRSDDRRRLTGFRQFGDTAEQGGFAAYEAGPLSAESTLTQDLFRTHRGAVWETRALLSGATGRVGFSGGPFVRVATRAYAESYYGVPSDAVGRAPYGARGGVERGGLVLQTEWRITDRIALRSYLEGGHLLGSAARSPLTSGEGGSRDQVIAGVFLVWRGY
jgi:outer membrane protein